MKKRRALLLATVICISITACGSEFDKLTTEMLEKYPFADNGRAKDDSFMKIDTNPYDKKMDDLEIGLAATFEQKQKDSIAGIQFMNEKLGFPDSVYYNMIHTTALMGKQTEENDKYSVSWTYHPDKGLEVIYEKK